MGGTSRKLAPPRSRPFRCGTWRGADAAVLAIIGSGVQAHSHLEALPLVRDFREIRVWSPNAARLQQFAAGRNVTPCDSAERAVRDADVVVLATASTTPVIDDAWVAPGTHVIAVGACRPTHRETDPRLVARALVVVDSRAAAMKEAGDILLAIEDGLIDADHVHAELGEVASGGKSGTAARRAGHALQVAGPGHRGCGFRGPGVSPRAGLGARHTGPAMKRFGLTALGGAAVLVLGLLWARPLSRATLPPRVSVAPFQLMADGYDTRDADHRRAFARRAGHYDRTCARRRPCRTSPRPIMAGRRRFARA